MSQVLILKNSLYAFGQSVKIYWIQCIIIHLKSSFLKLFVPSVECQIYDLARLQDFECIICNRFPHVPVNFILILQAFLVYNKLLFLWMWISEEVLKVLGLPYPREIRKHSFISVVRCTVHTNVMKREPFQSVLQIGGIWKCQLHVLVFSSSRCLSRRDKLKFGRQLHLTTRQKQAEVSSRFSLSRRHERPLLAGKF